MTTNSDSDSLEDKMRQFKMSDASQDLWPTIDNQLTDTVNHRSLLPWISLAAAALLVLGFGLWQWSQPSTLDVEPEVAARIDVPTERYLLIDQISQGDETLAVVMDMERGTQHLVRHGDTLNGATVVFSKEGVAFEGGSGEVLVSMRALNSDLEGREASAATSITTTGQLSILTLHSRRGSQTALQMLKCIALDVQHPLQASATEALAGTSTVVRLQRLIDKAQDPENDARAYVFKSLSKLDSPMVLSLYRDIALTIGDPLQNMAIQLLGDLKDPFSLTLLQTLVENSSLSSQSREAAQHSIQQITSLAMGESK